ncbi:MAG TPA: hypothetical protein VGJ55_19525 [Pyrinomonadaceae bacterium]|jgi:hypothetical protein
MKRTAVEISELHLRVPNLAPPQARRLGEMVAQRLAGLSLAQDGSRKIDALAVRVRTDGRSSMERVADEIATGVRRRLG